MLPGTLELLITFNPPQLAYGETLAGAASLLQHAPGNWAPLVASDGELAGGLSLDTLLQHARTTEDWRRVVVEDIATRTPAAAFTSSPVKAGRGLMMNRLTPLPVVDRQRTPAVLAGVVTVFDFLREIALASCAGATQTAAGLLETVDEPLEASMTLDQVSDLLAGTGSRYFNIQHAGLSLGVVSRQEILRAAAGRQCGFADVPATMASLVNRHAFMRPGDHIAHGAALCVQHQTGALAVINHGQRMEGVLPARNILEHALECTARLSCAAQPRT